MAIIDFALEHARQGRLVFPGLPNTKLPWHSDPYSLATKDEAKIIAWWQENPNYNICLPGGYEIGPGKYIGYVDVDKKNGGLETLEELDILGLEFPETLAQTTPGGGLHLFYYFDFPIQNSVGFLGKGIDTRGLRGYVIGAGSGIDGKGYTFKKKLPVADAPDWAARRLFGQRSSARKRVLSVVHGIDEKAAEGRATKYLETLPPTREGERNRKGFETACRLKDEGCGERLVRELMSTAWKCEPALDADELEAIIASSFKYGQNSPGVDAPENAFDPLPPPAVVTKSKHPFDIVNEEYALVTAGGGVRILWETKGHKEEDKVEHLSLEAFHHKLANKLMDLGEKKVPVSRMWMKDLSRREYDGIIFAPNYKNPKFFNVWQGFAVDLPIGRPRDEAALSLEYFLEHIKENVCGGDEGLTRWFLGFFAHMIQFPEKKPRVAVALRGKKGVGKNVITECIKLLLGNHYLLASNSRYLSGNFNSHMENKLLLVLDEAYWSGDKQAEGILKDLITGSTQQIERKGCEPYTITNLIRVMIFGNEEWIVPATEDERRYAVFEMGNARIRDDKFFGVILDGMRDHGGAQLLFKYLTDFDLTGVNVNYAPETEALIAQKEQTLDPFKAWWLSCLRAGHVVGSSLDEWPLEVSKSVFRDAFQVEVESQNIRTRLPNSTRIGRMFNEIAPSSAKDQMKREGDLRYRVYKFAPLDIARKEWEAFIGGKVRWNEIQNNGGSPGDIL